MQQAGIPWRSILKSRPVWAINVAFITADWCFYSLLICMPLYMKQVLQFDVAQVIQELNIKTNLVLFKSIGIADQLCEFFFTLRN